jgi:hypothetical protein
VGAVNAYHVFGVLFAVWAVILAFVGITREDFPSSRGAQRAVGAVSVLLAVATIGSAIYIGATEDDEEGDGGGQDQALILRI